MGSNIPKMVHGTYLFTYYDFLFGCIQKTPCLVNRYCVSEKTIHDLQCVDTSKQRLHVVILKNINVIMLQTT